MNFSHKNPLRVFGVILQIKLATLDIDWFGVCMFQMNVSNAERIHLHICRQTFFSVAFRYPHFTLGNYKFSSFFLAQITQKSMH